MSKVLFLALDRIINNQKLIPGVEKAIALYHDYLIIGVTNQGGVKSGFKTLEDCFEEQKITLDLIPQMLMIFFCTDNGETFYRLSRYARECGKDPLLSNRSDDYGNFRKPNPGMVNFGKTLYINSEYLMVGDRSEDQECAKNAEIPFMWAKDWLNQK